MSADERIASILGDWQARRERGEVVPPEQVLAAHPDLAGALRERFSALGALEQAASRGLEPLRLRPLPADRYRGFRKVGEGGMGLVYWALDTDLNRQVAFKMVRPDAGGAGARPGDAEPLSLAPPAPDTPASQAFQTLKKRFLQEAWVTGGMAHPGIVPVYEVGETPEGVPYYTMRFVKGERTLAQAIEDVDGRPIEERLALLEPLLKVCDAVRYAHAHGVVHRDLKPENVALGEFGEVVVLDWGLAKVRGSADAESRAWAERIEAYRSAADLQTVVGLLGTPGTMAPEAARGGSALVDERSDVYSLGAILFRLLTGRLPHVPTTFGEFLQSLQSREAPLATEVAPDVPPGLARLCAEALARDPAARTRSVEALAQGLRAWQRQREAEAEVVALLQKATSETEAAQEARGRLRARPLDRATAAVEQVLARRPGHAEARHLRARIGALREESSRQQSRDWRRRVGVRSALVALALGTGVVLWARRTADHADESLTRELEQARREASGYRREALSYRGEALAARVADLAARSRASEARRCAAQAVADLTSKPAFRPEAGGRAALEAAWPLWTPSSLPGLLSRLPASVRGPLEKGLQRPNASAVAGLAWTQGDLLLLASQGGLWRLNPGDPVAPPRPLGEPAGRAFDAGCGLAVAPDGRWAVALTADERALCLWELEAGSAPRLLEREGRAGWALPFTDATGARRLLLSDFLSLRVLDAADGRELRRLTWPGQSTSTPWSGAIVGARAFVGLGGRVVVLDVETGALGPTWDGPSEHLVAAPDGSWVAGWGGERSPAMLTVWDPGSGAVLAALQLPPGAPPTVALSPLADVAAVREAGGDGLALVELASGRTLCRVVTGPGAGGPLSFRADGGWLSTGWGLGALWDTRRAPDVQVLARFPGGAVAPPGGDPAVAVTREAVAWLERRSGSTLLRHRSVGSLAAGPAIELPAGATCLALAPGGRRAVVGTHEGGAGGGAGRLLLLDLERGEVVRSTEAEPGGVRALCASPDGEHVWLAREDREPPECRRLATLELRPHAQPTFPSHREGFRDAQAFRVRRLEALPEGTGVVVEWASTPSPPDAPFRFAPRRWLQVFSRSRGWSLDRAPRFPTEILGWAPDPDGGLRWLGEDRLRTELGQSVPAPAVEGGRAARQPPPSLFLDASWLRARANVDGPAAFTGLAVSDDGLLDVIPHLKQAPLELPSWMGVGRGPEGPPHHALRLWLGHPAPLQWVAFAPGTHVLVSACSAELRLHDLTWLLLAPEERLAREGLPR